MGRRIILKGVDFSKNGIYEPIGVDIDGSVCTILSSGINANTGELITSDTYKDWIASDFVDISSYKFIFKIYSTKASSFGLAFYDADDKYISGLVYTTLKNETIKIPQKAKSIRFCAYKSSDSIRMKLMI